MSLLSSRILSLPIRPERTRRRSSIRTRKNLGNLDILPFWPPESTRLRLKERRGGIRKTWVRSRLSTTTKRDILQIGVQRLKAKKLVLVLANFTSITSAREEDLECLCYIHYLVLLKKDMDKIQIQGLIKSRSEVNTIYLSFAKQLTLLIRPKDNGA